MRLSNIFAVDGDAVKPLIDLPEVDPSSGMQNILAIVFGVAGALAVLIIVIAGINFITGGDNPDKISKARNTIIYALIGLAIAITAEALVLTLLGEF